MAYTILPDFLSGSKPYAYGGSAHTETIIESCLAVAEQRLDDAMTVHSVQFKRLLAASVGHDRRLQPNNYGYNGDRRDGRFRSFRGRPWDNLTVTYNGVTG